MSILFDGVDDKIVTPSLSFNTIVFDVKIIEFDLFSTVQDGGIYKDTSDGGSLRFNIDWLHWEASTNGTSYSSAQYYSLSSNRTTVYFRKPNSATVTSPVTLFSDGGTYYGEGELFSVRFLLNGNTVAYYDMSTGTVQDQSGNGKHATLTGGTWTVTPGGPSGQEPIKHTLYFSETVSMSEVLTKKTSRFKILTDSIAAADSITKRLSVVVADSVAMSENESENTNKSVIDLIPINDTISISNTNARSINLTDSILIIEHITKRLQKGISDTIDLSDSFSSFGGKSVLLTDSINITDSISVTKQLNRFLSESVNLSDDLNKNTSRSINLYDVIVTNDDIDLFNPNAPNLIGIIHLQGKRDLFVYLQGKRDMLVYLQGERKLTIFLKGGLNVISNQNFNVVSGDSKTIIININEDLTGASFKWVVRKRGMDSEALIKQGSVIDGQITITLNKGDTEELKGIFIHECEVTDQNGNVSTITKGTVNILADMI